MMFIVISVVELGTKISSLLPILLDLCKNMKMNYFDISLSELRSHDILSSTFVVVLSFLDNITMQRFLLFSYFSLNWDLSWTIFNGNISDFFTFFSELRSLLVRLGNSSTILYFSDNIAMEIFLNFSHFSLNWDPSWWGWARGRAKWVQLHHRVRSWERFSIFVEIFEKEIFEKIKIF